MHEGQPCAKSEGECFAAHESPGHVSCLPLKPFAYDQTKIFDGVDFNEHSIFHILNISPFTLSLSASIKTSYALIMSVI